MDDLPELSSYADRGCGIGGALRQDDEAGSLLSWKLKSQFHINPSCPYWQRQGPLGQVGRTSGKQVFNMKEKNGAGESNSGLLFC